MNFALFSVDETESKEKDDVPARKKLNVKDEESVSDKVLVSFCGDVLFVSPGMDNLNSGNDFVYVILEGCCGRACGEEKDCSTASIGELSCSKIVMRSNI